MTCPVTIGDLRRKGELLEVGCTKCWHVAYVDPHQLPFHGNVGVPDAYRRMKCTKCGSRAGYSRPDARTGGVDGRYA